jgi:hypothetical protein
MGRFDKLVGNTHTHDAHPGYGRVMENSPRVFQYNLGTCRLP